MSNNNKVKVLLVGPIHDEVDAFVKKITTLQNGKAGPFDVCFVVGNCNTNKLLLAASASSSSSDDDNNNNNNLPLPVYIQKQNDDNKKNDSFEDDDGNNTTDDDTIQEMAPNLFTLRPGSICMIQNLCVASLGQNARIENMKEFIETKLNHASYVGCDILLSYEWPQGMEPLMVGPTGGDDVVVIGSFDVAEIALRARARYHIAPAITTITTTTRSSSSSFYGQSSPFRHLKSPASTFEPRHCGRFLCLREVQTKLKDKKKDKYVHALGLTPLQEMTVTELEEQFPDNILPCPYTDASYIKTTTTTTTTTVVKDAKKLGGSDVATVAASSSSGRGLSEAHARRLMMEHNNSGGQQHEYRWNHHHQKRKRDNNDNDQQQQQQVVVDPSCTTLFLHGLYKDVSNRLQTSNVHLLAAFQKYNIVKVKRPPSTSSFAFLEFKTHEDAKRCLQDHGGCITIHGASLTLKWANKKTTTQEQDQPSTTKRRRRLTEAQAADSSRLYFHFTKRTLVREYPIVGEELRKQMERTLEVALLGGDDDDDGITAETEPALRVSLYLQENKDYGFLQFASHAAASMAIATVTTSTDGGPIVKSREDDNNDDSADTAGNDNNNNNSTTTIPDSLTGIEVYWATNHTRHTNNDNQDNNNNNNNNRDLVLETVSGVKFHRQHFPPDSRQDCWFCLASEGCEKHLITTVGETCYLAMPKGPIHPGHVLIVPVQHTSCGILSLSSSCNIRDEVEVWKQRLCKHAREAYDDTMDLFVWERAFATRGGYHTHVQCVPIERRLGGQLGGTLLALAKQVGLGSSMREVQSDINIGATIEEEDGYFYAEILSGSDASNKKKKRFLYHRGGGDDNKHHPHVPLQFGREVLAIVQNKPELAHWKACVLDQEQEIELAKSFRTSFQPYYEDG